MINHSKLSVSFDKLRKQDIAHFICDYCSKEFSRSKENYRRSIKIINKDCCDNPKCKSAKTKECNLKVHGVESSFKIKGVKEKIRKTNIKKFGVENPMQSLDIRKKQEESCLEKYGVKNVFQNEKIKEKIKEKNLEKYGSENPMQSDIVKEKSKNTCRERYGVDHHFQSEDIKEKIRQTWYGKYKKYNPSQSSEINKKRKETCLEKYGHENSIESPEVQEKIKKIMEEKYGVKNVFQLQEIQEKIRQTMLEKYGVEHPMQNQDIKNKFCETNIERYGVPFPKNKFGKTQKEIQEWLNSYGFNFKPNHTILDGKELDMYDEKINFAIEYCGLFWHHENSLEPRSKNYHINKFKKCKEKGIQLITIFEDEWLNNQQIVKSIILSKIGIFEKRIYARKCITKEITKKEFSDFCDKYHVQGGNNLATACFGLFYEDELIGVMDLGKHHRKKLQEEMVLTRLCFKSEYQIIGGASKLFSCCVNWCKKNNIKRIISWSDNRWSIGKVYENLKFKILSELDADYSYVNISNPTKRISKQSQMKINTGCPKNISEKQWALQNGLSRIWDCGKIKWVFLI